MALILNEEQTMLQASARDFLQSRAPVSHLRTLRDTADANGMSRELWLEMADMGWPAMLVPEHYGGLDFGFTGLGLVLQESGNTLTPSALLSSAMMATAALLSAGKEPQKTQWLPGLVSGECIATLAFEEHTQHKPAQVQTKAIRTPGGYQIDGQKRFVIDGMHADLLIVNARSSGEEGDEQGISLFLIPVDTPGLRIKRFQALDTHVLAEVSLHQVQLAEAALLGAEGQGYPVLEYALDVGRIGQSAELLGVAMEVFRRSLDYLKERKQFGVAIGSFQALQHRASLMFGEIELCKSLVLNALQQLDKAEGSDSRPDQLARVASMTKAKLSETALKAGAEAIQWHGGIGMTDDFDIGFFYKRARILETLLGDRYYQLDRFARLSGY